MRLQGLEEIHLLGLASRPSAETDQPEDACGRRGDHGIARMFGKMGAAGGKRLHGLALDRQAKRIDVALLARRGALGNRAGASAACASANSASSATARSRFVLSSWAADKTPSHPAM